MPRPSLALCVAALTPALGMTGGGACGGTAPAKIICNAVPVGSDSVGICICGTEGNPNSNTVVNSCSVYTVGSPSACCAFNDATRTCTCATYICASTSSNPTPSDGCACMWGESLGGAMVDVCTGTHCCESPATDVLGGNCDCGPTPCPAGTTERTECATSSPPSYCPPSAVPVSTCL